MKQPTHPRILHITRNLPPLVGGMERLNWHIADELSRQAEVKVIGPKGSRALKPEHVSLTEAPLKPLPLFLLVTTLKAFWLALRWRPDVILAGSGLTAPIAWLASKLCRARSAVYLHGFDITAPRRIYQSLWATSFKKLDHVIVNSTPTRQLALNVGVAENRISIIHPGVTLPEQPQPAEAIVAFKQRHGLEGKKILLSVGRLTTRKGLREFVELALPAIVQQEPDCVLVIVGEAPRNSLGAGIQSRESIEEAAKVRGVQDHLKFLGVITDPIALATVYESSDVHVFPVRHIPDDPEGFGMVAIEAAAHGLPTAAFATGGIVDAVSEGPSGHLIANGDYAALATSVVRVLVDSKEAWATGSIAFARNFEWPVFGQKIGGALRRLEARIDDSGQPQQRHPGGSQQRSWSRRDPHV